MAMNIKVGISEEVRKHFALSYFKVIMPWVNQVVVSYRNVIAIAGSKCASLYTVLAVRHWSYTEA